MDMFILSANCSYIYIRVITTNLWTITRMLYMQDIMDGKGVEGYNDCTCKKKYM